MQNERIADIAPDSSQPTPLPGVSSPEAPLKARVISTPRVTKRLPWWIPVVGAAVLLLVAGAILLVVRFSRNQPTSNINMQPASIPLSGLSPLSLTGQAATLKINGQLQVNNGLVLSPTVQPSQGTAGQLYFDQDTNQLAYYNGQQFVNLGTSATATVNNTTVINSLGGPAFNGIELQNSAPGVQQTGNFNVSGTGRVGSLTTSIIDSAGTSLFFNPTSAIDIGQVAPGTPATLGLTTIGSGTTNTSIEGILLATKATMGAVGGTATSITVYVGGGSATKHIQVGVYEDDGDVPNRPASLLSTSASVLLKPNSFNTVPIPSVALAPNTTYWLAFNTDDTTVTRSYDGLSNGSCFYGAGYGFMPNPFGPGPCFFANQNYTIYANYTTAAGSGGSVGKSQFSLSATGQALFQNKEDSNTAFQVQNAAGTSTTFNVDTINGRVSIGKPTASYKLDIAAGDINLNNGRAIRFAGMQAIGTNATGTTTSIANFNTNGTVVVQAANFVAQDADGFHQNLNINNNGAATFSNRVNSTAGFKVQNATGTILLRADTSNMRVVIGNPAGDSTPVVLYLANKNTAGDPAGEEGGIYYNSTLGSFRCFYSGFWHNCADIEPRHGFSLYDEFMGGGASFSEKIGNLGWTTVALGANGNLQINPATPAPSADRPGVLHIQTPATINQGTTFVLGDTSGGSIILAKDNDVKTSVALGSTTGQVLRVGLHDQTSSTIQPLSGVWWEADPNSYANWRYCYGDGATATCAASSIALTADAWASLEIRITATGAGTSAATFVINNTPFTVSGVTIDTTNRVTPALSCFANAAIVQDCYWDYFQLTGTTASGR